MPVQTTNRSREAFDRMDQASYAGVDNAATTLLNAVRNKFGSSYYTGGRFRSTLYVKQSARKLMPYKVQNGWETQVGTKLIEALYWELGHENVFLRKKVRVRIWEPAAIESIEAMRSAYSRVVARMMGKP
jgi:hypothetical protein